MLPIQNSTQLPWILLGLQFALALSVEASSWSQFRGPNGSGVNPDAHPPTRFGPETNRIWKVPAPPGASSPVVASNRLFITSFTNGSLTLHCFEASSGRTLWDRSHPTSQGAEYYKNTPASSSPTTDGEVVVLYDGHGTLLAFNKEGREAWRHSVPAAPVRQGSASSPVIHDGKVILLVDQENWKSHLTVVDAKSGTRVWQTARPRARSAQTTPILWRRGTTTEIIASGSTYVTGFDFVTGEKRWSAAVTEAISTVPTPVVGKDALYVMSLSLGEAGSTVEPYEAFIARTDKNKNGRIDFGEEPMWDRASYDTADSDKDGIISREEYDADSVDFAKSSYGLFAIAEPGTGDITQTHVRWRYKRTPRIASPLYYRDRLYLIAEGGRLTNLDPATGKPVFEQERIGSEGDFYASPVAADGRIYLASLRGIVSVVAAKDELEVLATNRIGEEIQATPALVGDRLYLRSESSLWCFGSKPNSGRDAGR